MFHVKSIYTMSVLRSGRGGNERTEDGEEETDVHAAHGFHAAIATVIHVARMIHMAVISHDERVRKRQRRDWFVVGM